MPLLVRGAGGEGLDYFAVIVPTSFKTSLAQSDVLSSLQEHVLSFCEVTCLEHVSPLLFAGTSSGSVIMWNLETEKVVLRSV